MFTKETIENANRVNSFTILYPQNSIVIFSICDIWDYFEVRHGLDIDSRISMSWEEECKLIMDFCEKHNLYLYEKPREDFDKNEAIRYAEDNGYRGVVLSDLS